MDCLQVITCSFARSAKKKCGVPAANRRKPMALRSISRKRLMKTSLSQSKQKRWRTSSPLLLLPQLLPLLLQLLAAPPPRPQLPPLSGTSTSASSAHSAAASTSASAAASTSATTSTSTADHHLTTIRDPSSQSEPTHQGVNVSAESTSDDEIFIVQLPAEAQVRWTVKFNLPDGRMVRATIPNAHGLMGVLPDGRMQVRTRDTRSWRRSAA